MTTIKCTKTLYNKGKCFTKGKTYEIKNSINNPASLMECQTINDQNQPHIIGSFWRNFQVISSAY